MRDDANERDALLNHAHQRQPADTDERAGLPADLLPTHEALTQLAAAWRATTPPSDRLAAFARQLPMQAQRAADPAPDAPPRLGEHLQPQRPPSGAPPYSGGARLLAGVAAAVVIVGLLAVTLLKLAPGREAPGAGTTPTASATATAPIARVAVEPSHQPPNGAWSTVAHTLLIPAPSDGRIVYEAQGATARVSTDGGATWRTLTLPTFSQAHVVSESVRLAVGDSDPRLVLLAIALSLDSANPADCPAGSTNSDQTALHGGVLASGNVGCNAYFVSHDEGSAWTPSHTFYTAFHQSVVWQLGDTLYGQRDDVDTNPSVTFALAGVRLMASRDGGVTWSYADATLRQPSRYVCSVLPVAANDTLYAITSTSPCYNGATGPLAVWRSVDGGASWSQISAIDALVAALVAASPTPDGHGVWLYALAWKNGDVAPRTLFSVDGGATWSQAPQPPNAGATTTTRHVSDTLSDGSVVVAIVGQTYTIGSTPGAATFYAWRPGDSAWRPLTTPLTTYYSVYFQRGTSTRIVIARGGRNAVDTLWVMASPVLPMNVTLTTHAYAIR